MERLRVLITVKTYPQPSQRYDEVVCTAGVREDGSFVRLYPVRFRYLDDEQQYGKYQWISVMAERKANDPRPESYRPDCDTITPEGSPLGTSDGWAERKRWVLNGASQSIEELDDRRKQDNTSLGIIRPEVIEGLDIRPTGAEWSSEQRSILEQHQLFGPGRKPLDKVPFDFAYRFRCADGRCHGHSLTILDWEVGTLYRHMLQRLTDTQQAAEAVRAKFLDELCSASRDTWFYVGTHSRYPVWMVLGVFWPPKTDQATLGL